MNSFIAIFARCLLVLIFLPFSALDKLLNFRDAVHQASEVTASAKLARTLIVVGFLIEVVMSIAILTGIADRLAAFIMAGYCVITALLWKQFWKLPDFSASAGTAGVAGYVLGLSQKCGASRRILVAHVRTGRLGRATFFSQSPWLLTSVCSIRSGGGITVSETPTAPYWYLSFSLARL